MKDYCTAFAAIVAVLMLIACQPSLKLESAAGVEEQLLENASFPEPAVLLTDDWVPHVNVKLSVDAQDHAQVAFEDRRDENNQRVVQVSIDSAGMVSAPRAWSGQMPDLVAGRDKVTLLRVDREGAVRALRITE